MKQAYSKLIILFSSSVLSASVFATAYDLPQDDAGTSTNDLALTGVAPDTATLGEGEVYGGDSANIATEIITVDGGSDDAGIRIDIDGVFHGGERLIEGVANTRDLVIDIGSTGKLIATEDSSGNAFDVIDLSGEGGTFVATEATIINAGTIWAGDKRAVEADYSVSTTITNTGTMSSRDDTIAGKSASSLTITNSGTISADGDSISFDWDNDGSNDHTESKGTTTDYEAAIAFYGNTAGSYSDGLTLTNQSGGIITADTDTVKLYEASNQTSKNITITNHGTISATKAGGDKAINANTVEGFSLTNTGTISVTDDNAVDLDTATGVITINNSGTISAGDTTAINLDGAASPEITNSGTISATNETAIYLVNASGSVITNTGTISSGKDSASNASYTINASSTGGTLNLTNSGTISGTGNYVIYGGSDASSFTLNNQSGGSITSDMNNTVYTGTGTGASITNVGTISTAGNIALNIAGANATITNTGTLKSTETTDCDGDCEVVRLGATGAALTNSGTIQSLQSSGNAIRVRGDGNTITLNEGSVIIGDIELDSGTASNTIKFDVGSARSYVYTVTDNSTTWTLTDLDGRTAIEGSAKAAGVGNVETADEALFNRTNAINNSLARYARLQNNETWADVYVGTSRRSVDGTTTKYQQNLGGVTVVQPRDNNTQLIMALQRANLDISNNIQDVDTTSISVGLQKANAYKDFTGRAIVSYNDYDSSQEVLDNSSSTGYTTYTGDYDSLGLTLGLNKVHNHGDVTVTLDGEIAHERIDGYSETATFTWKDRNLTQATLSASGLWKKNVSGKEVFVNAGVTARGLISGKKANYTIDSTDTSFDGGNQSEVMATLGAGVDYNLDTDAVARFEAQGGYSNRKTASASLATTLDWKF